MAATAGWKHRTADEVRNDQRRANTEDLNRSTRPGETTLAELQRAQARSGR